MKPMDRDKYRRLVLRITRKMWRLDYTGRGDDEERTVVSVLSAAGIRPKPKVKDAK